MQNYFVSTSSFEGFPNTFLQAGKYGVPIISVKVDPADMLSQHECGATCNDNLNQMIGTIREFMTDVNRYAETSACCLEYVKVYHDKHHIIQQYEQVLGEIKKK